MDTVLHLARWASPSIDGEIEPDEVARLDFGGNRVAGAVSQSPRSHSQPIERLPRQIFDCGSDQIDIAIQQIVSRHLIRNVWDHAKILEFRAGLFPDAQRASDGERADHRAGNSLSSQVGGLLPPSLAAFSTSKKHWRRAECVTTLAPPAPVLPSNPSTSPISWSWKPAAKMSAVL